MDDQLLTSVPEAPKKPKKRKGPIIALCILLAVTLLMGGTALYVFMSMRAIRAAQPAPALHLPQPEPETETAKPSPQKPALEKQELVNEKAKNDEILDSYTIRRNGQLYRYNDQIINLLLLGVDADSAEEVTTFGSRTSVFADAVLLAAVDLRNNKVTLLSISRDTMCHYPIVNEAGEETTAFSQLALSYSFGDGELGSCAITKQAVSQIMSDLPIYSCSAMYFDGLGILNDAVGGVTLTPIETLANDYITHPLIYEGQEITMDASVASVYIRYREMTSEGNLKRLERQKQYLMVLMKKCISAVKEDFTKVLSIYDAMKDYLITDLSVGDIVYLASKVIHMDISPKILSLSGEVQMSDDGYVQYYLDEAALLDTILQVYYEPVQQP